MARSTYSPKSNIKIQSEQCGKNSAPYCRHRERSRPRATPRGGRGGRNKSRGKPNEGINSFTTHGEPVSGRAAQAFASDAGSGCRACRTGKTRPAPRLGWHRRRARTPVKHSTSQHAAPTEGGHSEAVLLRAANLFVSAKGAPGGADAGRPEDLGRGKVAKDLHQHRRREIHQQRS